MRHALVTTLENTPVIPAVKTPEELPAALRAEGGVVFLLCGDILNIGELIARIHAANRRAVVHADLVAGLAPREIAVDFLQCCGADGIISTRPLLIRRGRELGLLTVLRAFVIDSKAIESLAREAESAARAAHRGRTHHRQGGCARCALGGSTVRLDIGRDPLEYIKKCPRLGGQERGFSKAM